MRQSDEANESLRCESEQLERRVIDRWNTVQQLEPQHEMKKNEPDGEAVNKQTVTHGGSTNWLETEPKHKECLELFKGMAHENLVPKRTSRKEQIWPTDDRATKESRIIILGRRREPKQTTQFQANQSEQTDDLNMQKYRADW